MYGCESWTLKKVEHRKIDAFELWCWRRLFWESLGLQGDPTSPSYKKSVLNIHWKDWCWSWSWKSNTLAILCEELTHLKRPWCWERLKVGGKGDDRGWDGWMASPIQWTWVWVNSRSWWWTGQPSVLQSMGSQRVGHNWVTELNWSSPAPPLTSLTHSSKNVTGSAWVRSRPSQINQLWWEEWSHLGRSWCWEPTCVLGSGKASHRRTLSSTEQPPSHHTMRKPSPCESTMAQSLDIWRSYFLG